MDDRKKLQNKQSPLQGRASFPYLWQTARHRPPSTGTTATHLELSFLKNVKAFIALNPKVIAEPNNGSPANCSPI
ncbi:hypothetical protein Ancab_006215 [Ancistrocladus abbreviatus]